jgi:ribosomal protein S18 acetylase RimI-like enzyme
VTEIQVRRAILADLEDLAPLFDAYRQFYQQPADLSKSRAFVAERLTIGDSVVFLAESSAGVLGFTQLYPLFSSTQCRSIWVLNDLYVIEPARKRGVARTLMEAARQHAVETGAAAIELATAHSNLPARQLYESLGYVQDQTYRVYALRVEREG